MFIAALMSKVGCFKDSIDTRLWFTAKLSHRKSQPSKATFKRLN